MACVKSITERFSYDFIVVMSMSLLTRVVVSGDLTGFASPGHERTWGSRPTFASTSAGRPVSNWFCRSSRFAMMDARRCRDTVIHCDHRDSPMNKAFTREPDPAETARCPHCQSLGLAVTRETLESFVPPDAIQRVAESAFFCPYPMCDVVYFDVFDRTILSDSVIKPVYPKDPSAPICGCFGLALDDIEQDIREGSVTRCR